LECPQSAQGRLKTNANLNVEGSVISAAIIRAAPRFSRARFLVFNFTATRRKSKRLVQERITAWLPTQLTRAVSGRRGTAASSNCLPDTQRLKTRAGNLSNTIWQLP
jgi:hypothetical protein